MDCWGIVVKRKIVQSLSGFDEAAYINLVKRVGAMSQLFSDNDAPYIVSRFAERLFVFTTDGTDLARDDMSFDALIKDRVGVGVKTFQRGSTTPGIKSEKVAEYTADATQGRFKSLSQEDLALEATKLRNLRVRSDAAEYSIDLNSSITTVWLEFQVAQSFMRSLTALSNSTKSVLRTQTAKWWKNFRPLLVAMSISQTARTSTPLMSQRMFCLRLLIQVNILIRN